MNKLILVLMMGIFMLSFVSSAQESLGTFRIGENTTLRQTCSNCTFNNITSVVLSSVDSSQVIGQVPMAKLGNEFSYDLTSNYTTELGTYIVNGFGDKDGTPTIWVYDFKVTYTGKELSIASSVFYIILFVEYRTCNR